MNHFLTTSQLTLNKVFTIIEKAKRFAEGNYESFNKQLFVANLFFEPSTRTKTSFEVAERKLGMEVIPFEAMSSSLSKGETLYDTVKTLESIGLDLLVIRHKENEYFEELRGSIKTPIINAGDGSGHHPTQSMLDLFTIYEEFGYFEGLKVAIIGDIIHSRVAHSNAKVLNELGAEVVFSGPEQWFDGKLLTTGRYEQIDTAIKTADVVMMLRIQHERHNKAEHQTTMDYHEAYGLTIERERQMKPKSIIMHPAPVNRNVEIADELVECERSRIFKQMENGVFVRMAIIHELLTNIKGEVVNEFENCKWKIAR